MRKQIKHILSAGLVLLSSLQFASAFSIGGPGIGGGTGGDDWQLPVIGYGLPGDLNTPKNIGEEYRRVTPIMYYAIDSTFLNFFGLAGTTNVDAAFAVMNGAMCGQTNATLFLSSPTNGILSDNGNPYVGIPIALNSLNNLHAYPADLGDIPLQSQQLNYTAQALNLTDLKSATLQLLPEQMGLTEPERYAWTLHDRFLPPGSGLSCANGDMEFLVVQRNFDIIDSPLNQVQYSPYVNSTLYTYNIIQFCTGPNPLSQAVPVAVDIFADSFTAVASFSLFRGGFYTGLTRDDVAGFRYLYSTNNINFEAPAPSGGLLLTTNVNTPVNITTLPFNLLFSQSATNDPDTLRVNYPGIAILSVATNFLSLPTTNIVAYFTNLAGPYTNRVPISNNVAIYPAQGNTVPFTNWSPVQYSATPQVIFTRPLAPLFYAAQYLSPAELSALYPDILFDRVTTNYNSVEIDTNAFPYFTNLSVPPVFTGGVRPLPQVTVLTNIYYFTNQPGPTVINYDFSQPYTTISTLDLALFSDRSATNDAATMIALYPGLGITSSQSFPSFIPVTNYISYLTNISGAPYSTPPKLVTKMVSWNYAWVTNWTHTFANVFTNHVFTNRYYQVTSVWITNQIGAPYGSPFVAKTNDTTIKTNLISGDFFIMPTNWCGFDLRLAFPLGYPPYTFSQTNTIVYAGYNTNGSVGTNASVGGNSYGLTQSFMYRFTNYNYALYPGICQPVIRWGTNYVTNIVNRYEYNFLNVVTNHYFTNTPFTQIITNIEAIPLGGFDTYRTNITITNYWDSGFRSGDFYTVPTDWCGYQIVALLTNFYVPTNIVLTNFSNGTGGGGGPGTITNIQYTYIEYYTYTNYAYSIRPGVCVPTLAFSTNYTTNLVTQYSYYFGNIITNNYYTNGQARVVTTNISLVPGGYVGQLVTNLSTNFVFTGPDGDFTPIPLAWCDYKIIATQSVGAVYSTNTFTVTNVAAPDLGQDYSQTTVYGYTNRTLLIRPSTCDTAAPTPALRQGIGRVGFIRANYDSLLGQFFQPLTNEYVMIKITNSQPVKEYYRRVITQPDLLMRAQDLTSGPSDSLHPVVASIARSLQFDQSQVFGGLAGPGTITPATTFTYNKVGNVYANGSLNISGIGTNAFLSESTQGSFFGIGNGLSVFAWASFDSSTNTPVIYPNGTSIANLVNQIYLQVSPSSVPDGTHGVAYAPVVFTGTGGQTPYVWSAPNLSTTVPGMSFNPATATLSGTPTAAGTFSFTLQLTDAVNRVITLNYSITIH
jgi:hypothetical protein